MITNTKGKTPSQLNSSKTASHKYIKVSHKAASLDSNVTVHQSQIFIRHELKWKPSIKCRGITLVFNHVAMASSCSRQSDKSLE